MTTKKKVLTGIAGVLLVAATAGYGAAHIITAVIFIRIRRSTVLITGSDRCAGEKKIAGSDTVLPDYQIEKETGRKKH